MGIHVLTGEKWSRIGGKHRDFVSFTDVLDIAEGYSTIKPEANVNDLSFEVVIGTTVDDIFKVGSCVIPSDIPEVGVINKLPLANIKVIGVPSDKVDYVKKLVLNDEIKVFAIDGINDKFYWFDDFSWDIHIDYDLFDIYKNNLSKPNSSFTFKLEEIRDVMYEWFMSKGIGKLKNIIGGEKSNYDGRIR